MDRTLFVVPPRPDAYKLIGWGVGSGFAEHYPRHPLQLAYTIDPDATTAGTRVHGVEVRGPDALRSEDPARCLVLVYAQAWFMALWDIRALGPFRALRAHGQHGIGDATRLAARIAGSPAIPHPVRPARRGIVVQGPLHERITETVLRCYALLHPGCAVILSTWKGEDADELRRLRPLVESIVLSDPPAYGGDQNRNYQVRSTLAGLDEAKRLGVKRVAKARTDSLLGALDAFDRCDDAIDQWPVSGVLRSGLRHRIALLADASWRYVPYHFSDQAMYGDVDDMRHYWSAAPQTTPVPALAPTASIHDLARLGRAPESYFAVDFLHRSDVDVPGTVEHSWEVLRDGFVALDATTWGWIWWKLLPLIEDPPDDTPRDPLLLYQSLTHAHWRGLQRDDAWRTLAGAVDRAPPSMQTFRTPGSKVVLA